MRWSLASLKRIPSKEKPAPTSASQPCKGLSGLKGKNDYGFCELSRVSVAYRKLFGDFPSPTLRGAAEHVQIAAHFATRAGRLAISSNAGQ